MRTQENINKLNRLKSLLNEQIELAHQGNSTGERIVTLSEQADDLVKQILQTGVLEQPDMADQKKLIHQLYDCLFLSLSAQKAEVEDNLNQIRKGRKTVETYRNHI